MRRIKLLVLSSFLIVPFIGWAQSPDVIVQQQLEAYNQHDLDAFMGVFHGEASVWRLGAPKPVADGFDEVKKLYEKVFADSPNLHSTVINRTIIGNTVIDYERITGRNGGDQTLYLVMVYQIEDGKIKRAYSISE